MTADFLLAPVVWGSLLLLIVNDHVLKSLTPGPVTWKLSDIAGMVFFPVLLVAIAESAARLRRRDSWASRKWFWFAAVAVAIGFAAVKAVDPARDAYAYLLGDLRWALAIPFRMFSDQGLGSPHPVVVVPDLTDIWAVSFTLVAVWVGYRWRPPTPRSQSDQH